jgi:putative transferase (TIGR04331 family)
MMTPSTEPRRPPAVEAVFLATTALEEFWDPSRRMLFLGEWCRLAEREAAWAGLAAEVLEDQWLEPASRRAAERYCSKRVAAVLDALAAFLNGAHGERHDLRYWRILVGPWLLHFTQALYDRHRLLERAFERSPGLDSRLLSPGSYVTPRDWADYTYLMFGDDYNLQLCSQLLAASGHRFPTLAHQVRPHRVGRKRSLARRCGVVARRSYGRLLDIIGPRRAILLHGSRLGPLDLWRLVVASRRRVWPFEARLDTDDVSVDMTARTGMRDLAVRQADRFTDRLLALLPVNLPVVYLEGYRRLREDTRVVRRRAPRVVASGLGWKSNERFKCVAADAAERGARLIGLQHGGSSWVMEHSPMDQHIDTVADEYWSWGRREPGLVPTPDPGLGRLVSRTRRSTGDGALFVGTMFSRYVTSYRSQPIGAQVLSYIRSQATFFSSLSPGARGRFLVRLYPHELGWSNRHRLDRLVGDLRFDDFSRPFSERVAASGLVVVDNLQTAFVETLLLNRPVVLFYDPTCWGMSEAATHVLERLREAAVLHHSAADAAAWVSRVLEAPGAWWETPEVQHAREAFLDWCIDRRPWLPVWRAQLLAAGERPLARAGSLT